MILNKKQVKQQASQLRSGDLIRNQ